MKMLLVAALAAALLGAFGNGTLEGYAISKSAEFTLHLNGPADSAFPLFDPVNEKRWDPHWNPRLLAPDVEEGLVFLVGEGEARATWLLDRYDRQQHRIAYVAVSRSVLTRIMIAITPAAHGCDATVRYVKTPLGPEAEQAVDDFVRHFPELRAHWERAINAVLRSSHG
jgi:hypothetical protein